MIPLLGSQRERSSLIWLAIICLAFLSVGLTLWSIPQSAIQYWYLYFSPLVLAAFRDRKHCR